MPIELFSADDSIHIRQSFDSPTIYMDHWAIRYFSNNLALQDRFVTALKSKRGTLLISNISFAEFAEPEDSGNSYDAGVFIQRLLPNIYLTDFALDKILDREQLEVDNENRFWPSADLPQLKLLAELSPDGQIDIGIKRFFEMTHLTRNVTKASTKIAVDNIYDAFEKVRRDPHYVHKARHVALDDKRSRTAIIMGELMRGFVLDGGSLLSRNDIFDFLHALMPLNSCDYVLLDGSWEDRVRKMKQRISKVKMVMPLAQCFSRKNNGIESFLANLEAFTFPDSRATP